MKRILFLSVVSFIFLSIGIVSANAKNLIPGETSFETSPGILVGGDWGGSNFEIDPTVGTDGKQSLKVQGSVGSREIIIEPNKTYTFSLYAKGEQDNTTAEILIINTGWRQTLIKTINVTKNWERYVFTFKPEQKSYWLGFRIKTSDATIWLDAYQLEEGDAPTPYKNKEPLNAGVYITSKYNNVFFPGEEIKINFSVYKAWKETEIKDTAFFYEISDFYGSIVKKGEIKVVFNNKEERFNEILLFKPEKLGLYIVRSQFKSSKDLTKNPILSFAVVKPPVDIEKGLEAFCAILGHSSGTDRVGAHWIETALRWPAIEAEKGKYKWDSLSISRRQGYKTTIYTRGVPKWAWDPEEFAESQKWNIKLPGWGLLPSKEHLTAWRNFIREAAIRSKDNIDIWEIGGEEDLVYGAHPYYKQKYPDAVKGQFVTGPVTDRVAEMVRIAAEEIKKVNPKAIIGAVRPSGVDCNSNKPRYTFSKEIFKGAGDLIDVFPLDCYCFPPRYLGPDGDNPALSPPLESQLYDSLKEALEVTKKYSKGQPIYISEFGYALDINEPPDSEYAKDIVKRLARTFLIARATPDLLFCRWFTGQGAREAGKYEYGLWRDGYPLATVPAFSAVAHIVENVIESKTIDLGQEDTKAVVFKKSNQAAAAVWMVTGEGKITISNNKEISISDVMGNPIKPEVINNKITLKIGEYPTYLTKKGLNSFEELYNIISPSRIYSSPVEITFKVTKIENGTVSIKNLLNQDLEAEVLFTVNNKTLSKKVKLPKDKTTETDFPLTNDLINKKSEVKIEVSCGKEYEKSVASFPLEFSAITKVNFPVKIDGNLSEWKGFPFISMNERGQIMPPDPWISWDSPEDLSAKVYIGYDENNFYLAGEVTDDKHYNNKKDSDIWNGDCIQFAYDILNDAKPKNIGYNEDDYELGLALTATGATLYRWQGKDSVSWSKNEYKVIRDEKNKKTIYELKIPLSNLNLTDVSNRVIGFSFVIFDDDEGAGQSYYYLLSPGIADGKNPYFFKKFVFMPGG